ncbi:hypothetical protein BY996DRAFT_6529629 [Phakopsora pachyrhizi]|uniref:Uncharacterized protein n=1 Tax=Phakopsora pachyrhizi TaxID=170000 RepID=A0AAV0B1N5_PHAPC|nr:hypothetical protein BY996DRAFT_6529629 [Phakopsora pachyrhizi]CAH7675761.1 hypothetical protein PPACK8108_LOCUS10810 [Phakopsora pachyrhizi]
MTHSYPENQPWTRYPYLWVKPGGCVGLWVMGRTPPKRCKARNQPTQNLYHE